MLRTGDPCPCCGQPIKTKDLALLAMLTYIRDSQCNQEAFNKFLGLVSDSGLDSVIKKESEGCTLT